MNMKRLVVIGLDGKRYVYHLSFSDCLKYLKLCRYGYRVVIGG